MQNQQEYIIQGLIDGDIYKPVKTINDHFDKSLQSEGITCASCHVRDGAIIGPHGSDKAPHKTIKDTIFLSEQLCIGCHNASAVLTPPWHAPLRQGMDGKPGLTGVKGIVYPAIWILRIVRSRLAMGQNSIISIILQDPVSPSLIASKVKLKMGWLFTLPRLSQHIWQEIQSGLYLK
ncbi:MAG: hypothetical protein IPI77_17360 [Saprospiraceae bacterium]|nr:hypothetical protein [Saprospiraceae bacterium]